MILEYLNSLTFELHHIVETLIMGFVLGVAVATLLYVHITNGTIARTSRYRSMRDCDERYD